MSLVLCFVSTSSGATIPGKITMSDKPSMGKTSGRDWEETRAGASGLPAAYDLSQAKAAYLNGFLRIDVPLAQRQVKNTKVLVAEGN